MNNFKILLLTLVVVGCQNPQTKKTMTTKKIVIAHRGASGYLPEHTLEAKAMAYAMHPDYLEQDIVLSKDDVPIVVHDITLDDVTDVAQVFPSRKRADGKYYVIDFTYKELLQLNVSERFDTKTGKAVFKNRFPLWKSHFKLHSLQDEIEMIQGLNKSTGENIGIYPEIKEPAFHLENGKDISVIVLKVLSDYGYNTKKDNCILQCFDATELKRIRQELKSNLFLVQLTEFAEDNSKLPEFATYADGVGPYFKQLIKKFDPKTGKIAFNDYVKNAHELGMVVHAYTFRADQLEDLPSFDYLLDLAFNKANLDGVFTDFSDKAFLFINKN
ncbi:MAG: glycerophosphodiester phosphodiesterase [Flavobacteriales bacterium]|jgi:glycerophosphoryl diester phosphodiesterase|nr:glycerophosphodiester phosphodiesterase [Flavobacteriales bacterium]